MMLSKLIKRRKLETKGRLYLQDSELNETVFAPGTHYRLEIEKNNVTIVASTKGTKVSKRKLKTFEKPVIDIRSKEALAAFEGSNTLEVFIYSDHIEIKGYHQVVQFGKKRKQFIAHAKMDKHLLKKVVGLENQINLFEYEQFVNSWNETQSSLKVKSTIKQGLDTALRVVSLFSGAGLMDTAFKNCGYNLKFALELEPDMCRTYKENLGNHIVCTDITQYDLNTIPDAEIIIAGSPCQDFSSNNFKMKGAEESKVLDSPKNKLVRKFIEVVQKTKSCKVALLENVPELLTKGKRFVDEIKEKLKNFSVTVFKLNATKFGSAQSRERAFIIASKIGPIHIEPPKLVAIKTVKQAFEGLTDDIPNQMDYSTPRPETLIKMAYIKPGENFKSIPEALRPKSQQSNMFRRLEWDKPSITIVNVRKSQILHPELNRTLTVRECCRLFDLPDTFIVKGSLDKKQQMIANGIPVKMVEYIANQIKQAIESFSRREVMI